MNEEPNPENLPTHVPTSLPNFRGLTQEEQRELRRLHCNLEHPSPEKMSRFLKERGASEEVQKGITVHVWSLEENHG